MAGRVSGTRLRNSTGVHTVGNYGGGTVALSQEKTINLRVPRMAFWDGRIFTLNTP